MGKRSDEYRRKAAEQSSDADEMESGRWRVGNIGGTDETAATAKRKRGLAARLLGLADAYDND